MLAALLLLLSWLGTRSRTDMNRVLGEEGGRRGGEEEGPAIVSIACVGAAAGGGGEEGEGEEGGGEEGGEAADLSSAIKKIKNY